MLRPSPDSLRPDTSELQLRLQYSMTLVRLVNGISDSAQKGRVASSVAALAEDAGAVLQEQSNLQASDYSGNFDTSSHTRHAKLRSDASQAILSNFACNAISLY